MLFIIDADWVQQLVSGKVIDRKSGLLRPLILPKDEEPPAKSSPVYLDLALSVKELWEE